MKKTYETPSVEIVEFRYTDQVVASSTCTTQVVNIKTETADCSDWKDFTYRN